MRVLILKKGVSTIGGSESHARELARTLATRGHEVTLVGLRPAWSRAGLEPAALERDGDALIRLSPARFGRVGAALDTLLPTSLLDEGALRARVGALDVVHSLAREYAGIAERLAGDRGAAYVETPLVHPGQPFSGTSSGDVARYRRAGAILALTEWERGWYVEHGVARERIHVTGVGPILRAVPQREPEGATILFVGRREPYKGYLALARATRTVWRTRPDARFVIVGQRAWHAPLTDRIVPSGDPRWVDLGVVDEVTKADAYASCAVFCMPSRHETFGQTYLEAWLARRPVIAGDIPPLREIVEGAGLCVPQHPEAIAEAVLRLLADPTLARALGDRGYERATTRYSWDAVGGRVEAAYEHARRGMVVPA